MEKQENIGGKELHSMLVSAANTLENNEAEINDLNVFPVPDGDTGTNMSLTMGAVRDIDAEGDSASDCADKAADAVLRSARGNSGAILALFFRGFSKTFKGKEAIDSNVIADAFENGKNEAYKAVMNPTEGTILTVIRRCAEEAKKTASKFTSDLSGFFSHILKTAENALSKTPEQLPVLKEAGVVDAGGKGFVFMLSGMLSALIGKPVGAKAGKKSGKAKQKAEFSDFDPASIKFAYCTECIVEKSADYQKEGAASELYTFISGIGDSAVFADTESIIKLHIHTNAPGDVITEALRYGTLSSVKVENMKNQHSALIEKEEAPAPVPTKKYGFVAVCMGDGIRDMFLELGVDKVVYGGQTMNPSMQDILDAVNATPAKHVFILPNNKNIDMVATQAAEAAKDKKVTVIHTRSVPEGISSLLAFDESLSADKNAAAMSEAVANVKTIAITHAVRNATVGGVAVSAGEAIGLVCGKLRAVGKSNEECIERLLPTAEGASVLTVFYGNEVTEQAAEAVKAQFSRVAPNAEILLVHGGQPLYDYIISVE